MTYEECEQFVNLYDTLTLSIRDLEGISDHEQVISDLRDAKESLKDLITSLIGEAMGEK